MKNLKKFENDAKYFENINYLESPAVSLAYEERKVYFRMPHLNKYVNQYFTFEAIEKSTIRFTPSTSSNSVSNVYYSVNNGETWINSYDYPIPELSPGEKVIFKRSIMPNNGIGTFSASGKCKVYGNIMSLLCGDNFADKTDFSFLTVVGLTRIFYELFYSCTNLVDASNLILPATDLMFNSTCYAEMFRDCTGLINPPAILPATNLSSECYTRMFEGCTSLTSAPILPATVLKSYCYEKMFYGCTSLIIAPNLPATTLAPSCYSVMFYGCTNLTKAPDLLATTLVSYCYSGMFYGCTSLNYIKCLAENISASNCTANWVKNVAATGTFISHPDVSWTIGDNGIPTDWINQNYSIDYSESYLTFKVSAAGNIYWKYYYPSGNSTEYQKTILYSLNNGSWTSIKSTTAGVPIAVEAGDIIKFKTGDNLPLTYNNFAGSTAQFEAYGNLASLESESFINYSYPINCYKLFYNTGITSAENLVLPTVLSNECYKEMFSGCTNLIKTPALNVTTLATYCYQEMFKGCTSLTNIPILPASTLSNGCYAGMFNGCTGLTSISSLPATTLASRCYAMMFCNCINLVSPPALNVTTLAEGCYAAMFSGCTSLTTAPVLQATSLANYCYEQMFFGCTSLINAPALPATALATGCYSSMFFGCTNLTTAPDLLAPSLLGYCYEGMFGNCSSLNYIKCLATDISASSCTSAWVQNVALTGTFVKISSTNFTTGINGIPTGWTVAEITDANLEYVEVTQDINDVIITTDINTSSISSLKIITSFYTPVRTNNTTIFKTQKISSELSYTSSYYKLYNYHNNIVEHDQITSNISAGVNIVTLSIRNGNQGYGGYYLLTPGLSSPANNYPYSNLDTYNTSNTTRLYSNYTNDFSISYSTYLQILCSNNIAGTRFYGMKVYNGSTLIYDLVPARRSNEYGLYEKINNKFYSSQYLTGA